MFIYHWWWGGDPDAVIEVSGMTLRDIYKVQTSWKTIHTTQNGFLMFFRLFEAAPETKSFFKSIANLQTREEMMADVIFRAHVVNVMAALNNSIVNLNQPELVTIWMKKLGDAHELRRVQKRHFWIFKDVLVNILQDDLQFSEDIIESWGKYVTFTYEHMLARITN